MNLFKTTTPIHRAHIKRNLSKIQIYELNNLFSTVTLNNKKTSNSVPFNAKLRRSFLELAIWLFVGSMALELKWARKDYEEYKEQSERRIRVLKDNISTLKLQSEKQLDPLKRIIDSDSIEESVKDENEYTGMSHLQHRFCHFFFVFF